MGTVLLGWATATEAAALGVVAAVIIGVIFGDLTLPKIWQAFFNSTVMFGAIGLVMMGALILAQALSILGLPQQLAQTIADAGLTKYWVLLAVVAIYLVLGCFFDGVSMMLMTLPLVFPVMTGLGFDAVWLGVIITILVEIGMLTPPVGMNLFILSAITNNEVSLGEAAKASVPYWLILLGSVGLLTVFPEIALALTWIMD
jgi:C4-dicarboxylate transporter, DctM subunit